MKRILFFVSLMLLINIQFANAQGWEWAKSDGDGFNVGGKIVKTDKAGFVYELGYVPSTLGGPNALGILFEKYDSYGNQIWYKLIGGNNTASEVFGTSMSIDAYGDIYITGYYYGSVS